MRRVGECALINVVATANSLLAEGRARKGLPERAGVNVSMKNIMGTMRAVLMSMQLHLQGRRQLQPRDGAAVPALLAVLAHLGAPVKQS